MMKNTLASYGHIAKFFHWLMAILFIGMFTVAYIMINMSKSDFRNSLYGLHKATGILLFSLVSLRLAWRLINSKPALPKTTSVWQRNVAKCNIAALYLLMFLMPMTGFLTSTLGGHDITFYGIFTISPLAHNSATSEFYSNAHEILSYMLIATFILHVMGAVYHHYFLKDNVLIACGYNINESE